MTTFIRAAEIWRPDADGQLLEFGGGLYGQAPTFGALSRSMCFGRGEGLPGRVWDEGRPVVLQDLGDGHFQRAAAARQAGFAAAVAFPILVGARLRAIVVLFCGDLTRQSGAIEVWQAGAGGLRLADGVYGARDAEFEAVSRRSLLAPGAGLPGRALALGGSVFVNDLADSPAFVRGAAAAAAGLKRGIAFPCTGADGGQWVLALLSAAASPIATRVESWVAGAGPRSLERAFGHDERLGALAVGASTDTEADAAALTAFATGLPTAASSGTPVLALPIVRGEDVAEVVALVL